MSKSIACKTIDLLLCVSSFLFFLVFVLRSSFVFDGKRYFTLFDDAMISMTFARTLAQGKGLVWYPGASYVEGYTNFLWTIYMSLVHVLPIDIAHTSLVVMLSGVFLLFCLALSVRKIAYMLSGNHIAAIIAMFFSLTCFSMSFWTLRGMEVGLISLLCVLMTARALTIEKNWSLNDLSFFSLLVCLTLLVRLDGVLCAAALCLYIVVVSPKDERLKVFLTLFSVGFVTLFLHTIFRYYYYNDFLPNTYYLKVGGTSLDDRVLHGLQQFIKRLWDLFPFIFLSFFALLSPLVTFRSFVLLLGLFCLQCVYSIYVGGDAWEQSGYINRYITQGLPFLYILASVGLVTLVDRISSRFDCKPYLSVTLPVIAVVLVVFAEKDEYVSWYNTGGFLVQQDQHIVKRALEIKGLTKPGAKVAVVCAGVIPYFSERDSIDLLGKSDATVANSDVRLSWFYPGHMKWNYHHSIGNLRPDLVEGLWFPTPEDYLLLKEKGYVKMRNGMYKLDSSNKLRRG